MNDFVTKPPKTPTRRPGSGSAWWTPEHDAAFLGTVAW